MPGIESSFNEITEYLHNQVVARGKQIFFVEVFAKRFWKRITGA